MNNKMDNNWKYKIEKDIHSLAQAISNLSVSLEKFIEYSKEMQNEKFSQIYDQLLDHEKRIRYNTRFIYQAIAIIGVLVLIIDLIYKLKIF